MKRLFWLSAVAAMLALVASSAYAQPACPSQPANADGTTITSPTPDQVVASPFTVQGDYFGSFEGVVPIRVLDAGGAVLLDTQAMNECCTLSPYSAELSVPVRAMTPACVVVYRESGDDGSLTPLAQVPVTLAPAPGLPGTGVEGLPLGLALLVALSLLCAGALLRRSRATRA